MKRGGIVAVGYFCGVGIIAFVAGLWTADDQATLKGVITSYQTLIASFFAFLTAGAAAVLGYLKLDSDEKAHRDKLAADGEAARAKMDRAGVAMMARIVSVGRRFASGAEILQAQPNLEAARLTLTTLVREQFPPALKACDDVISHSWTMMPEIDARAIDSLTGLLGALGSMADDARRMLALEADVRERALRPIEVRQLDFGSWRMLDNMVNVEPAFSAVVRAPARPDNRAEYEASMARSRERT